MPQQYTTTVWVQPFPRRRVTYLSNRPAINAAPLPPFIAPLPQQSTEPVNLDEMIRKKREKARRMKPR
jgi:hypothetical protein